MTDALSHLSNLLRGEIALARSEIDSSIRSAAVGLGMLMAAIVFAITALNAISAALIAALIDAGLPPAGAALLVGVAFALLAIALARQGSAALRPSRLIPNRTLHNLAKDAETLKEAMTNE